MTMIIDDVIYRALVLYLTADVFACLFSSWYVRRRQLTSNIKSYDAKMYRYSTLALVVFTQVVSSIYLSSNAASTILNAVISFFYVVIALVDIQIRIVPNSFIIVFLVVLFIWRIATCDMSDQLSYLAFAFIIYCILSASIVLIEKIANISNGMGMGDIKLLCATAYLLGIQRFTSMLLVMLILLLVFICIQLIQHSYHAKQTIAFAPFISLSTMGILLLNL